MSVYFARCLNVWALCDFPVTQIASPAPLPVIVSTEKVGNSSGKAFQAANSRIFIEIQNQCKSS